MSILATAAAAAFNAIISPFSPHRRRERAEERAEDVEQYSENGDLSPCVARTFLEEEETTTTRTTRTTTTTTSSSALTTFLKDLFRDLARKVKQNHMFLCSEDDRMDLRESGMAEHKISKHKCWKKGHCMSAAELKGYFQGNLTSVECVGINPYKQVELHFKYGPQVPEEYREDVLYCEPDSKVMAMVKVEKSERAVFRAKLKRSKQAGLKEMLESIAYFDDDGNEEGVQAGKEEEGHCGDDTITD